MVAFAQKISSSIKNQASVQGYMDKKLGRRMKTYLIIAALMVLITIYEKIISGYSGYELVLMFVLGIVAGFFFSRMFQLTRNPDEELVTSRIDRVGRIILVLYMLFAIGRYVTLREIFHQQSIIMAITFAIAGGIMIGRFLGIQVKTNRLVKIHKK